MDATQLTKILRIDPMSRKHFRGVFPRDVFLRMDINTFPNISPSFYVCNLDKKDLPGSHWVVVEVNHAAEKVFYFDSYGMPPTYEDLLLKLSTAGYQIIWNDHTLQNFDSTVCGQYCALYCLLRSRHIPFRETVATLRHQHTFTSHARDHTVYDFLRFNFPIILSKLDTNIHNTSTFSR